MTATTERRIYVACLSSYNSGVLHGRWIDATQGVDHIREEIAAMLAESKYMPHEEWAVHDSEGFPESVGEYPDLDKLAELAEALDEHGDAYAAYVSWRGLEHATVEDFQDAYAGEYDSKEAYAEEYVNQSVDLDKALGSLAGYFDFDKFAHELEIGGDMYFADADGGRVYAFHNT